MKRRQGSTPLATNFPCSNANLAMRSSSPRRTIASRTNSYCERGRGGSRSLRLTSCNSSGQGLSGGSSLLSSKSEAASKHCPTSLQTRWLTPKPRRQSCTPLKRNSHTCQSAVSAASSRAETKRRRSGKTLTQPRQERALYRESGGASRPRNAKSAQTVALRRRRRKNTSLQRPPPAPQRGQGRCKGQRTNKTKRAFRVALLT